MNAITTARPAATAEPRGEATRQAIMTTAGRLFAEHGIAAVSLRRIVTEAGVNTAAVHYHFGSKQGLLEAVFARHAAPIAAERLRRLAACREEPGRPPLLEQIVTAFLVPSMCGEHGGAAFARLRARMIADSSEATRELYSRYFDESSARYLGALARALPDLPARDLHWRFHSMLGVMVYTLLNPGRIQILTAEACDPSNLDDALAYLVPMLAQMFRAPAQSATGPAPAPAPAPAPIVST